MSEFAAAFASEIRRAAHSVLFWWVLVIAPLTAMFILVAVFAGGQMRDLPVAAVDLDKSSASRDFLRKADSLPSMRIAQATDSQERGDALLRTGQACGVIIIPRNFERDLQALRPAKIIAYFDGQHMPAGSVLRRDLTDLSGEFWKAFYVEALERQGIRPQKAQSLAATLSIDLRAPGNASVDYRVFLDHGFLPVLIELSYLIYGVCRIKSEGALGLGKSLGILAFAALFSWLWCSAIGFGLRCCGAAGNACPYAEVIIMYLLLMICCTAQALFIAGITDNRLQGLMFVSGMASPALAFTGLTFPLTAMPYFAAFWAGLLPVTHVLTAESAISQRGASLLSQLPSLEALALLALVYAAAGIAFLRVRARSAA